MTQVQFRGWWRPASAGAAPAAPAGSGRRTGTLGLTVTDMNDPAQTATRQLSFDLAGPADVTGLTPAAVVRTYPAPGASDVEFDKAVYVELAAPDLPWRYTLTAPQGNALRPWLAVLVGTVEEIEMQGSVASVAAAVLADSPIPRVVASAHVEQSGAVPIARVLSVRALVPDAEHRAILVSTYGTDGAPAWNTAATTLTPLHEWTFRTRAGGDFAVIARRLHPEHAGPALGSATVRYAPLAGVAPTIMGGALVSIDRPPGDPTPPTSGVADDLAMITASLGDDAHPVLGLPRYDESWPDDAQPTGGPASGWRAQLRADPRPRGAAGLGAQAGVQHQDALAAAAARLAGAYQETAERLRRLRLGVLTTQSLWRRRMPADGARRLALLGPALRAVHAPAGAVVDVLTRGDRVLSAPLFSTAAKRAWRGADDTHDAALRIAAVAPAPAARDATAMPHTDELARAEALPVLDDTASRTAPGVRTLVPRVRDLAGRFDRGGLDVTTKASFDQRLGALAGRLEQSRPTAILPLLRLLDAPQRGRLDGIVTKRLLAGLDADPDSDDLASLGRVLTQGRVAVTPETLDLDAAAVSISAAFDPTGAMPAIVARVLDGIADATASVPSVPLEPAQLLPELRLPAWRFLRDEAPDWLLPGAGALLPDTVLGLATNPAFVDAFLLGLNAQVLAELRFRNSPILPMWTPLRSFWDRADSTGPLDDIAEIAAWPGDSGFGSPLHQTPAASGTDLVILFNTPLFRVYPGTLVYLVPAAVDANGRPDWRAEPSFGAPVFPAFQGQVAPEQVFFGFALDPDAARTHWVVLEETPQGRRFRNLAHEPTRTAIQQAADGATLAAAAITRPRRVLIRGDTLIEKRAP